MLEGELEEFHAIRNLLSSCCFGHPCLEFRITGRRFRLIVSQITALSSNFQYHPRYFLFHPALSNKGRMHSCYECRDSDRCIRVPTRPSTRSFRLSTARANLGKNPFL